MHVGLAQLSALTMGQIGESDCEFLSDDALAQPVNSLTSLAYVVVGAVVIGLALRRGSARLPSVVYGSCVASIGLGSVLFHGPQTAGSRGLHDLPILITVIFIVLHDLGLVVPRLRVGMVGFAAVGVAVALLSSVDPGISSIATGVGLVAAIVLEVIVYRRQLRPLARRSQLQSYGAIVAVAAIGAASWVLGRTGSPACDPDALFQFHGAWHVISSLAFGLWWWLAYGALARVDAERVA